MCKRSSKPQVAQKRRSNVKSQRKRQKSLRGENCKNLTAKGWADLARNPNLNLYKQTRPHPVKPALNGNNEAQVEQWGMPRDELCIVSLEM